MNITPQNSQHKKDPQMNITAQNFQHKKHPPTKRSRFSKYLPFFMWAIVAIFYLYENILQVSPSVMVPDLMRALHVDAETLGNISAFYFYAYAAMQIPVGLLFDRFGPRFLVSAGLVSCALGAFLFGDAHIVIQAEAGRFLIGLGGAFAAVGCLAIAANWFSYKHFALLAGMTITVGFTGAVIGESPLAAVVLKWGWRHSMFALFIIGLLLATIAAVFINDNPRAIASSEESPEGYQTSDSIKQVLQGLKTIINCKGSWLLVIYGGLMFAPTSIFGALWGVPFLEQAHHLSRANAAGCISMLYVGYMIGAPLCGYISNRLGRRKTLMSLGSLAACLCMLAILYLPALSLFDLSLLIFAFGLSSSGFLLAFSVIKEINSPKISGTALGYMNMFNMIGGAAGQPLVGFILDKLWTGHMTNGARHYSVSNFHYALAALPIMLGASMLLTPFIRETFCRPCYKLNGRYSTTGDKPARTTASF